MSIQIRKAIASDLEAVLQLLQSHQLPAAGVVDHFANFVVVDGPPVAACGGLEIHGKTGLLRSVAVEDGMRGKGLGQAVTKELLQRGRELGMEEIVLLTTTAAEFFLKFGFAAVERDEIRGSVRNSIEFREACPASAMCMRLRLE